MMVFKRKQIVILALILLIVVVGYLQYSYRQSATSASNETGNPDEAAIYVNDQVDDQGLLDSENSAAAEANVPTVNASKAANDFFAQAKMDKEQTRSKSEESLKAITDDTTATKEARDQAYSQMISLSSNADKEMRIETLIDKMGFSDCIALVGDDGSVDIVIKTPSLTNQQVAQIQDTVSRQANVAIENIVIKKLY